MTLRDRSRPTLPVGIEGCEFVDAVENVVTGQDLGAPSRGACPGGEECHLGLARGERVVERREVGNLEGHNQQPDAGGDDLERPAARTRTADDAEREHGGAGDLQGRTETQPAGPPGDKAETQNQRTQPKDEERHHGGGTDERHEPVTRLVGGKVGQHTTDRPPERARHEAHGTRRSGPGHNQRGEHAERSRGEDENTDHQSDQAQDRLHPVILS